MARGQIIVQDYAGFHAGELEQGRSRVLEGGSWKQQRVVMVLPAGGNIPSKVALALMNLSYPPNNPNMRILALGLEVGEAYSTAVAGILDEPNVRDWEYLLTVEHDNLPRPDSLMRLIRRMEEHPEFHAFSGLYFQKGEGGFPQIWGDPKSPEMNFRPQPPVNGELVECNAIGMGFSLYRLSMFKDARLRRPWFVTRVSPMISQDLYFWEDAHDYGYRCAVDCAVKVGHLDQNTGIVW